MLEGSNLIPNNSVESIGTGCCVFDNGVVTSAYAFGATSVNCKLPAHGQLSILHSQVV